MTALDQLVSHLRGDPDAPAPPGSLDPRPAILDEARRRAGDRLPAHSTYKALTEHNRRAEAAQELLEAAAEVNPARATYQRAGRGDIAAVRAYAVAVLAAQDAVGSFEAAADDPARGFGAPPLKQPMTMKRLLPLLALAAVCFAPHVARAGNQGYVAGPYYLPAGDSRIVTTGSGTLCATGLIYTITLGGAYSKLRVGLSLTYNSMSSATLTAVCSMDGTNFGRFAKRDLAAATIAAMTETWAPLVTQYLTPEYDVRGCKAFRITVLGTGCGTDALATNFTATAGN